MDDPTQFLEQQQFVSQRLLSQRHSMATRQSSVKTQGITMPSINKLKTLMLHGTIMPYVP
jgi:hypothetical protein